LNVVMLGTFGMSPKSTMRARALPMAQALVERGHFVQIVVPPWDKPADSGARRLEEGIFVRNIRLPHSLRPALIPLALVRETLRLRPDVVHVFKPKGYGGLAAMLLRAMGKKVVVDSDDWEGRGGWNDLNPYSPAERVLFDLQERFVPRISPAVTVASRTLEGQMLGFRLPPDRVFYVPNGVSAERYGGWPAEPSDRSVREFLGLGDRPVVLLYTRFVEFRVERVVEVLRSVVRQIPNVVLLVVGRGFFGEEEELRRQARHLGLEERVVLAGWVDRAELPRYLTTADVALVPFDDNLVNRAKCSVKLLELMVLGRAIVADRVGQNREYLRHMESGLLTDPADPEALAKAIVTLLEDNSLQNRLGGEARTDVWRRFDWSKLIGKVEEAYRLC
jgi:glycosyltransferase involved in cell wall biosynthesis